MKEVLITYKGSSRTRIVSQAHWRATLTRMRYDAEEKAMVEALGTMHKSPIIEPKERWRHTSCLDFQCWKTTNRKARKGWQRHSNRTMCRNRRSRSFGLTYYPSIRLLNEQGGVL